MPRAFQTLDVFTDESLTGNPLAVMPDAAGLDGEAMQRIAREFNLSETVFVLPPEHEAHSARLRIFTPASELAFAGHPTVGTAIALALRKIDTPVEREQDALIVLEQGIGPVRVGVRLKPGNAPFAEFDAPVLPEEAGKAAPNDRLAAALGLAPGDIGFENHVPTQHTAGNGFTFVPVRDLETIARATAQLQHWREAFPDYPLAFLYCRQTVHAESAFHARMFAPTVGIPEDPATGSAAAAIAAPLVRFDEPRDGVHSCIIEQGYEMHRPSNIFLEMDVEGGKVAKVRIGGYAVPVMEGTLSE